MHTEFTPDFPGDTSTGPKYIEVKLTKEQTRKLNSFPGPDNNRFIDAFIRQQHELIMHREGK